MVNSASRDEEKTRGGKKLTRKSKGTFSPGDRQEYPKGSTIMEFSCKEPIDQKKSHDCG